MARTILGEDELGNPILGDEESGNPLTSLFTQDTSVTPTPPAPDPDVAETSTSRQREDKTLNIAAPWLSQIAIQNKQLAAQIQQAADQLAYVKNRLKVLELPEAQSRDQAWRHNMALSSVEAMGRLTGRTAPAAYWQQILAIPGLADLGTSPFGPGAAGATGGGGAAPSIQSALDGLMNSGWNSEEANAYRAGGPKPSDASIIAAWNAIPDHPKIGGA